MNDWLVLLVSVLGEYCVAYGAGLLIRRWNVLNVAAAGLGVALILPCPLLVPAERVGLRAIASVFALEASFKLVDFAREVRSRAQPPSRRELCRFLIPFPFMLVVLSQRGRRIEPPQPIAGQLPGLILAGLASAGGFALLPITAGWSFLQANFALDHALKVLLFVVEIEVLSQFVQRLERLCGFDSPPPMQQIYLARTVAEFWRRHNTRVYTWHADNVFLPCGGRRKPIRGIVATFLVSGLYHELMFGIATSRFDGYQLAFFTLQIPAVLLSRRVERIAKTRGRLGRVVAHVSTILWFAVTSILFFHGVSRIFPMLYAGGLWLP